MFISLKCCLLFLKVNILRTVLKINENHVNYIIISIYQKNYLSAHMKQKSKKK